MMFELILMFFSHIYKTCEVIAIEGLPPITLGGILDYSQYLLKLTVIYSSVFEQYIERVLMQ